MRHIENIRKFKTRYFCVSVDAYEENDLDLSFDESGEFAEKLESGELCAFCVGVTVYLNGSEIGSDYLGGCIYERVRDFEDHRECAKQTRELRKKGSAAIVGSYFADMVREAIAEARESLNDMKQIKIRSKP